MKIIKAARKVSRERLCSSGEKQNNTPKRKIIFDHNKSVESSYHKPGPQSSMLPKDHTDS